MMRLQHCGIGHPCLSIIIIIIITMLPTIILSKHFASVIAGRHLPRTRNYSSLAFMNHHHRVSPLLRRSSGTIPTTTKRAFHRASTLYLNRILFDTSEIDVKDEDNDEEVGINDAEVPSPTPSSSSSSSSLATVTLSKDDYRTIHVAKILGLQNGDTVRAGSVISPTTTTITTTTTMAEDENGTGNQQQQQQQLAGLITDEATIQWIPEGKIKKAQPTKNGDPPGSLQISIPFPPKTSLWNNDRNNTSSTTEGSNNTSDNTLSGMMMSDDVPPVSLLLALPRPLALSRILPMVTQLGIDTLILTNARKVPKDYFGSHLFRKPEVLRNLLIEGLAQSGDVRLPNVVVTKRLKIFMEDEFDEMFGGEDVVKVIAHPQRRRNVNVDDGNDDDSISVDGQEGDAMEEIVKEVRRMTDVKFPDGVPRRIVVAVGPEGGWEEPYELDMFKNKGFQQITLGTRVLRSDVAVVSLLSLAHEVCAMGDDDAS